MTQRYEIRVMFLINFATKTSIHGLYSVSDIFSVSQASLAGE